MHHISPLTSSSTSEFAKFPFACSWSRPRALTFVFVVKFHSHSYSCPFPIGAARAGGRGRALHHRNVNGIVTVFNVDGSCCRRLCALCASDVYCRVVSNLCQCVGICIRASSVNAAHVAPHPPVLSSPQSEPHSASPASNAASPYRPPNAQSTQRHRRCRTTLELGDGKVPCPLLVPVEFHGCHAMRVGSCI